MGRRLLDFSLLGQEDSQVDMGLRIIGFDL